MPGTMFASSPVEPVSKYFAERMKILQAVRVPIRMTLPNGRHPRQAAIFKCIAEYNRRYNNDYCAIVSSNKNFCDDSLFYS